MLLPNAKPSVKPSIKAFPRRRAAPARMGFTLVELAIAFFVFLMTLGLFGAVFPVATRAGHVGGNYLEASFLAQHKIDQFRNLGAANLDATSLMNQGVVDASNGVPVVVSNPAGLPASMVSYSFTLADNLVDNVKGGTTYPGFFPAGSTGIVSVGDYHDLVAGGGTNAVIPVGQLKSVVVTISWAGSIQGNGTLTTHTAIKPL